MSLGSFHEKKDEVARALGELGAIARELGAASLGARVARDLVKKLEEDRFHLVVVGEFNHGKSTFVNALLGAEVGAEVRYEIQNRSGQTRAMSVEVVDAAPTPASSNCSTRKSASPASQRVIDTRYPLA